LIQRIKIKYSIKSFLLCKINFYYKNKNKNMNKNMNKNINKTNINN